MVAPLADVGRYVCAASPICITRFWGDAQLSRGLRHMSLKSTASRPGADSIASLISGVQPSTKGSAWSMVVVLVHSSSALPVSLNHMLANIYICVHVCVEE